MCAKRSCIGMKLMELAKRNSKSRTSSRWPRFVMCLDNRGYPASLEVGKVYRQVRPKANDMKNWIRVIDESGEDYLFPSDRFEPLKLPARARRAITKNGTVH